MAEIAVEQEAVALAPGEFAPGNYIVRLSGFGAGGIIAFRDGVQKNPDLKLVMVSGGATGIELTINLEQQLRLCDVLATLPGVDNVGVQDNNVLVSCKLPGAV